MSQTENIAFPKETFPFGCCPLMSGQVIPLSPPGGIQAPNTLSVSPVMVPCAGPNCQFWTSFSESESIVAQGCVFHAINCHVGHLSYLAESLQALDSLTPPRHGPTPLMRIADLLEEFLQLRLGKKATLSKNKPAAG